MKSLKKTLTFAVVILSALVAGGIASQLAANDGLTRCDEIVDDVVAGAHLVDIDTVNGTIELIGGAEESDTSEAKVKKDKAEKKVKVKLDSKACPPGQMKKLAESIEFENRVIHAWDCDRLRTMVEEFEAVVGKSAGTAEVNWMLEAPEVFEKMPDIPAAMDMKEARKVLKRDCE